MHPLQHGICRTPAELFFGGIHAAHAGFRRERHADHILRHPIQGHAEGVPQFDDGTAFRSFVAGGGKAGGLHHFIDIHAGQRQERRGHAVAERDRPGLVEQQHIHVPGGLHRAARQGQHIALEQAVHPGDADGREQAADRGRDEAHQQRHQHDHINVDAVVKAQRLQGDDHQHEDEGQPGKQDVQSDFVGGLLPFRAFDKRDHAVEERLARLLRDVHDDAVGKHRGPAGNRAAVAAGFTDDRSRLAGDGGFVHGGHTFDNRAVGGDHVARLHDHTVAGGQFGSGYGFHGSVRKQPVRDGVRTGAAERVGLRLAPPLGQRLGEVGEQHGEPQPQGNLAAESGVGAGHHAGEERGRRKHAADGDHEHDGIAHEHARIELAEGVLGGLNVQRRRGFLRMVTHMKNLLGGPEGGGGARPIPRQGSALHPPGGMIPPGPTRSYACLIPTGSD